MSYGFSFPTQGRDPAPDVLLAQLDALREETHQLRNAGSCRHEIGIAQGILMLRHGIDQEQAYAVLSRRGREHGVHVRVVARAVVTEMGSALAQPRVKRS